MQITFPAANQMMNGRGLVSASFSKGFLALKLHQVTHLIQWVTG